MNGKVIALCASRNRNIACQRMIDSFLRTTTTADLAIYVDDDQAEDYRGMGSERVHCHFGPRIKPCRSLNVLLSKYPDHEAYGAFTDDSEFLTNGWDQWALETARSFDGPGAFHPYLVGAHVNRMDYPWVNAAWVDALGWLCHPWATHYYWDVLVEILAEQVGLVRATQSQFAVVHDSAPTEDAGTLAVDDSLAMIVAIATERFKLLERLRCHQPTS